MWAVDGLVDRGEGAAEADDDLADGGFVNHNGRGEAEGAVARFLGHEAFMDEGVGEGVAVHLVVDFDADEEAAGADFLDEGAVELLEAVHEDFAEASGAFGVVLGFHFGEGSEGDGRAHGVATKGAAVITGLEDIHDVALADGGTDGEHASAEGLADSEEVGFGVFVHPGKLFAGAAEAGLDFVPAEEDVFFGAEFADLLHVAGGRNEDATFGLDGFGEECGSVGGDGGLEGFDVTKGDDFEAGGEGAEVLFVAFFAAESDDGGGATVEVVGADNDFGLVVGDAFDGVRPLSGELDTGFVGLGAGVHGADDIEFGVFGEGAEEEADFGAVEGAADEGDAVELFDDGALDGGREVSVGDGGVGADAVDEFAAFAVPDAAAFGAHDVDGEGFVVLGSEVFGVVDGFLGGELVNDIADTVGLYVLPQGAGGS